MQRIIGRIAGMAMQIFGVGLVINDHPNPLQYEPFFGSFEAEKIGGILIIFVGVAVYRSFGGYYKLLKEGFTK